MLFLEQELTSSLLIQTPEQRLLSLVEMSLLSSHILDNRYYHQRQPITIFFIFCFDYFIISEQYELKCFHFEVYIFIGIGIYKFFVDIASRVTMDESTRDVIAHQSYTWRQELPSKLAENYAFYIFLFLTMIIQMINSYSLFYIRYVQFILAG